MLGNPYEHRFHSLPSGISCIPGPLTDQTSKENIEKLYIIRRTDCCHRWWPRWAILSFSFRRCGLLGSPPAPQRSSGRRSCPGATLSGSRAAPRTPPRSSPLLLKASERRRLLPQCFSTRTNFLRSGTKRVEALTLNQPH